MNLGIFRSTVCNICATPFQIILWNLPAFYQSVQMNIVINFMAAFDVKWRCSQRYNKHIQFIGLTQLVFEPIRYLIFVLAMLAVD